MTAVESAITEITEALSVLQPDLEGLRDFRRLVSHQDTIEAVDAAIIDFQQRVSRLETAQAACVALMADGHPSINQRIVPATVLAELTENLETILAASKLFKPEEASNLNLTADAEEASKGG